MIPACFFPPSFQQLSLVLGGREEMEGYPEAPGVFAEAQIESPAEGVFPGPRAAGIRQDRLGIRRILGAVSARFGAGARAGPAGGGAAGEAAQARGPPGGSGRHAGASV